MYGKIFKNRTVFPNHINCGKRILLFYSLKLFKNQGGGDYYFRYSRTKTFSYTIKNNAYSFSFFYSIHQGM